MPAIAAINAAAISKVDIYLVFYDHYTIAIMHYCCVPVLTNANSKETKSARMPDEYGCKQLPLSSLMSRLIKNLKDQARNLLSKSL